MVTDDDILNGTIGNGFVNDFTTQTGTATATAGPIGPTTMADALENIDVAANNITDGALWTDATTTTHNTRATITAAGAATTNDMNEVRHRIEELETRLREEIEQRQIEREIDGRQNERGLFYEFY